MPSSRHRLLVEDLDLDAKLHQLRGAAGEFRPGVRTFAGSLTSVLANITASARWPRSDMRGARRRDRPGRRRLPSALASASSFFFGLVMVEFIGAQPAAERKLARLRHERRKALAAGRTARRARAACTDLRPRFGRRARRNPRRAWPASPPSPPSRAAARPTPIRISRLAGNAGRRENFERSPDLPLNFAAAAARERCAAASFEHAGGALAHREIAADENHQRSRMPGVLGLAQQRFGVVEWLEFIFGVDEHQGLLPPPPKRKPFRRECVGF